MALIKCDGISIAYEGQTVVRDLSFWIEQGDYLCIVGENGSGKSTLVKSLLGLKPPFKGQILLGDGLKQDEIGYLPQQTVVQKDFPASVYEGYFPADSTAEAGGRFTVQRIRRQPERIWSF